MDSGTEAESVTICGGCCDEDEEEDEDDEVVVDYECAGVEAVAVEGFGKKGAMRSSVGVK